MGQREEMIKGLRAMADFFEDNPQVDIPYSISEMRSASKEELVTAAKIEGGWEKEYTDTYFNLTRRFSDNVSMQYYSGREAVCDARVVGKQTVIKKDNNWIAERTQEIRAEAPIIEVEEDVIEWDCHPLLASDSSFTQRKSY